MLSMNERSKSATCPICRKPCEADSSHLPFCSARCKQNDLGAWASESYRIPSQLLDSEDEMEQVLPVEAENEQEPVSRALRAKRSGQMH